MHLKTRHLWLAVTLLIFNCLHLPGEAQAHTLNSNSLQSSGVTAYDLIAAMNTLRVSYGLPALIEDPIINAVAQSTADIMAANQMSWHIGDVRGRLKAAGYGGGATVWATENFAVGNMSIDEIMQVWSDAEHMRPAVIPSYCNVGAGVAQTSDGQYYYILQAAYTSNKSCGDYVSVVGDTSETGDSTTASEPPVSQIIIPVKIATPDADGKIYHVVEAGQSFWSIAIAYKITIKDIETWNNISKDTPLKTGQRLFIPGPNTEGFATPTPVGMIVPSTPDAEGKIIHTVGSYQALIPIAEAYGVAVDTILQLNGLQIDWPLQIGQKLLIYPGNITPSPTPRPLTPVEKLTPSSDGNYYHMVQNGETLSWIAGLYNISLNELMAWNEMNNNSIIHPGEKLLLQVTPPATLTPTPGPPTPTLTATRTPNPPTHTPTPSLTPLIATATFTPSSGASLAGNPGVWIGLVAVLIGAVIAVGVIARRKTGTPNE